MQHYNRQNYILSCKNMHSDFVNILPKLNYSKYYVLIKSLAILYNKFPNY